MSYLTSSNEKSEVFISSSNADYETHFHLLRSAVEDRLQTHVPTPKQPTQLVDAAMHYAVESGHRWRPLLLISVYEAMTGRDGLEVVDAACAIEIIHCCTIILDDLPCVDNAALRRGRPSCHIIHGEAITIYASHLLYALAEHLATRNAKHVNLKENFIRHHFYKLRRRLVEGQILELNLYRGSVLVDDAALLRLYSLKASPFTSATWLGAALGGGERETAKHLHEYGK
jgi:geranylgeranyl pyrophosphate synthase